MDFPCGLLVTNAQHKIVSANGYFQKHLKYAQSLEGRNLDCLFSKASLILFESYLYPQLLADGKVEELQATILDGDGQRIPVVINAEHHKDQSISWAIFVAVNRDELYEKLLSTREQLESHVEQLRLLAHTDDLTGLLNRKEALYRTEQALQHGKRENKALAIILMDVDFFKQVNDNYGHDKGDQVLVGMAQAIKAETGKTDVVARWGGEEFLVVLYDADQAFCLTFLERVQNKLSTLNDLDTPCTASFGIALCHAGDTVHETTEQKTLIQRVIHMADMALYEAKNSGRNKVVFAPTEVKY